MDLNNVRIMPRFSKSKSARLLAGGLGVKRIHRNKVNLLLKKYHFLKFPLIINWGCRASTINLSDSLIEKLYNYGCILNNPLVIKETINKLTFFTKYSHYNLLPKYYTNKEQIENFPVFCRTILNGHGGEGIVYAKNKEELVDAPLYTEAISIQKEYRLHLFKNKIFHIQEKRKMPTEKLIKYNISFNPLIRNHKKGWIFAIEDINIEEEYKQIAEQFVEKIEGLDFCAIDCAVSKDNKFYILEINTGPALLNTTLRKYIEVFSKYIKQIGE